MGINALPDSTVRAIGACQALNDPTTVIKELIDNALDARATSIAIEISNNTVDSIQVRDNGHGIPPEDRPLIARPHCTSKISGEDDLNTIAGVSLGFRGEALASIAEMSGSLVISTRVEGEEVAAALKINQQGEVVDQHRASFPVGTTIKITEFVKAYPVRNQNALKNSEKCLKKIKQCLHSYAFARPNVRLSLRVLKARSDKINWTYAPKSGGNVEDAAIKIVGAACASQCTWSVIEHCGFTLQAFLPKVDGAVEKVTNIGAFISIDRRPVSATRSTPKQLVKLFRDALKRANATFDGVKEPFMYLDVACPLSSYDANVEPAKDDVLFEDLDTVVEATRRLLDAVYPVPKTISSPKANTESTQQLPAHIHLARDEGDFLTSLELPYNESANVLRSEQAASALISYDTIQTLAKAARYHQDDNEEPMSQQAFRSNMYGCDEEDLDLLEERTPASRTEADFEELRQARKDVKVSNPWVIAKMHAASRRPVNVDEGASGGLHENPTDYRQPNTNLRRDRAPIDFDLLSLPTPRPSSPPPLSPKFVPSEHVRLMPPSGDSRVIGSQSLSPQQAFLAPSSRMDNRIEIAVPELQTRHEPPLYDYLLSSQASDVPAQTPLHAIPAASTRSRRGPRKQLQQAQINKPFVSPLNDQTPGEKVWFDHLDGNGPLRQRPSKRRQHQHRENNGLVNQGELGDLAEDPHLLTPPRRNRDMRDFVTHVDLSGDDTVAGLIESRNYPKERGRRSETIPHRPSTDENVENSIPTNMLCGSDFVPASHLATIEAQYGPVNTIAHRPSKRRKTAESCILRELSGNAQTRNSDDEDFVPVTAKRGASRRRTTDGAKSRRMKSSQLPLERVPAGQGTCQIKFNMSTTSHEVSRFAGMIDEDKSLRGWAEGNIDAQGAPSFPRSLADIRELTGKLYNLLVNRVSDGEMVQDLGMLVQAAFTAREARSFHDDVV